MEILQYYKMDQIKVKYNVLLFAREKSINLNSIESFFLAKFILLVIRETKPDLVMMVPNTFPGGVNSWVILPTLTF